MAKFAVVVRDVVQNVIEWDGEAEWQSHQDARLVLVPDGSAVSAGWTHSETAGQFQRPAHKGTPPAPVQVPAVSMSDLVQQLEAATSVDDLKGALISYFGSVSERARVLREARASASKRARGE
jgi:hypothetical protein